MGPMKNVSKKESPINLGAPILIIQLMAEGIDVYLLKECSIKEIEEPIENVCKKQYASFK
jgi:DNA-binding NarL/FixJ family response regulator